MKLSLNSLAMFWFIHHKTKACTKDIQINFEYNIPKMFGYLCIIVNRQFPLCFNNIMEYAAQMFPKRNAVSLQITS